MPRAEFGKLELDQIDYPALKHFCLLKAQSHSRDSVRLMMATLRVILNEAVREEVIGSNPVTNLGRFYGKRRREREDVDPFTKSEMEDVLRVFRERFPSYYEFVLGAARTGLRFGERRYRLSPTSDPRPEELAGAWSGDHAKDEGEPPPGRYDGAAL